MDKKYQIFVSSTYNDLKNERNAVSKSILDLEHIPAGMELFPAFDQEQLGYIEKVIDQCDYYVLLIAGRYGSVDAEGVSYTEREYDYALKTGKPVLAFVKKSDEKPLLEASETDKERVEALERFKAKASSGRVIKFWANEGELSSAVIVALTKAFREIPQIGWVRADQIADNTAIRRINELQTKNEELALAAAKQEKYTSVVTDLAGIDDTYTFSLSYHWGERPRRRKVTIECTLTWSEIARAILPYIVALTAQSKVTEFIAQYLRKTLSKDLESPSLSDEVIATVCIQLEQLGLVKRSNAPTKSGGTVDCIKSTREGVAFTIRTLAVRKAQTVADAG